MGDQKDKLNNSISRQGVVPVDIVTEMKESYLDYAMSVIVARALPDVRDGLKPVHRRILYSMHELGLFANAKFRKSAAVVGDVLAKYHPHGDAACYDALTRLAQDFSMRYPLVTGQGNFGSIDGDSPAAMRYTESKMSYLANELLRDIEKETVNFSDNYDGTRREPVVLPAAIPNLLLNGTLGIAVGMATKIPPHNLTELMEALDHLAANPTATSEDLTAFVKGPDFPVGGIIFNHQDIRHAYATGRGGVVVRGEAEIIETAGRGGANIVVTSIPYQINKADLIVKIADLIRDKKLDGIKDIRDESTKDIRVVIELKNTAQPQKILNSLYKHTDLETTFHFNMLALVDGVPRLLSLKSILEEFIKHRQLIVTRRATYDLKKATAREHILLGLKRALDQIDAIIKTIKKAKDAVAANKDLMTEFKLSAIQATAILEMRLQKLAGLERRKVEDELKEKQALIRELKSILADPKKILKIIRDEFATVKSRYGDPRRTKIIKSGVKAINPEDLIPEKENVLVLSAGGYLKRTDPMEYRSQRRGGKGVMDLDVKEEDFVSLLLSANTHSDLLFFTDRGKVYQMKMYDVPEGRRATRGKSIMNFLSLAGDEQVTSILAFPKEIKNSTESLFLVTRAGVVKKVAAESFKDVRRSGIIAIRLTADDELFSVFPVEKNDTVILASAAGQAIRFKENDVRTMGRAAAGVRAMKLKKGDLLIGAGQINRGADTGFYLVMSENGFGKKTKLAEYKVQKRGGSGIKTAKVTPKIGKLIASRVLTNEDEIIAISKQGQIIRTGLDEIPTLGRQTQGVKIMKLKTGDKIASLVCF